MSDENENENEYNGEGESEQEEDQELNLEVEEAEEEGEYEYVYGIALPQLPEGLQPLSCLVLIEGIMMDSGQPTITAIGSEDMKPWVAVGIMRMEASRLENAYTFGGLGTGFAFDGEDDEDEDEEDEY